MVTPTLPAVISWIVYVFYRWGEEIANRQCLSAVRCWNKFLNLFRRNFVVDWRWQVQYSIVRQRWRVCFVFFCGAECLWRLRVATGLLFSRVLISFYFNIPDFFSGFARVHAVCSLIFWPRNVVGRGICYALVCLSVRPSVCLSHAWITPEGSKIFKYALYHTYDRAMFRVSWGQIFTFEFRGSPQRVR